MRWVFADAIWMPPTVLERPPFMMRITLDSPALIAVRSWLADLGARQTQRSGRNGRRTASRLSFRGEQLEPRLMLDAGMRAVLPDLVEESDTGASFVDNFTSDRTPTLSGSVLGAASQVRLMIDGKPAAEIPVADGTWNYTVPAEAALAAGNHRFAVLPLDASGKAGKLSKPLSVTIETKEEEESLTFEITLDPADVGKVIGRQGRIIKSIRTLARAAGSTASRQVEVEILG